jgi:hypothetical protein
VPFCGWYTAFHAKAVLYMNGRLAKGFEKSFIPVWPRWPRLTVILSHASCSCRYTGTLKSLYKPIGFGEIVHNIIQASQIYSSAAVVCGVTGVLKDWKVTMPGYGPFWRIPTPAPSRNAAIYFRKYNWAASQSKIQ